MKIVAAVTWAEDVPLRRPYEIATRRIEAVQLFFVRVGTDRDLLGVGSASPGTGVTGETAEACRSGLAEAAEWLRGRSLEQLPRLLEELGERLADLPAARAALDMALHDLWAQELGVPLVEALGRCHDALPTSMTIGILGWEETLAEAEEHLAAGFRCLKVKTGHDLGEDLRRLRRLRRALGEQVLLRVDANQGYDLEETRRLLELASELRLELVEQPVPARELGALRVLPAAARRLVAADESLLDPRDALELAAPEPACGIFNVKLMKCGGIAPARRIGAVAGAAGLELMWGCNDESRASIAAALHAALADPATRYLDLDGSFDLARDPVEGGFLLEQGVLRLTEEPGLGVRLS